MHYIAAFFPCTPLARRFSVDTWRSRVRAICERVRFRSLAVDVCALPCGGLAFRKDWMRSRIVESFSWLDSAQGFMHAIAGKMRVPQTQPDVGPYHFLNVLLIMVEPCEGLLDNTVVKPVHR